MNRAYRYNHRKDMNDGDRFSRAVSQIVGKRLTFDELTGKNSSPGMKDALPQAKAGKEAA